MSTSSFWSNVGIRILDGGYLVYKEGAPFERCSAEYACESVDKVLDVVKLLLQDDEKECTDE